VRLLTVIVHVNFFAYHNSQNSKKFTSLFVLSQHVYTVHGICAQVNENNPLLSNSAASQHEHSGGARMQEAAQMTVIQLAARTGRTTRRGFLCLVALQMVQNPERLLANNEREIVSMILHSKECMSRHEND
jgi:hypothetical protein